MPLLGASVGAPTCANCQTTMHKRDGSWHCPNPWCPPYEEVGEA